MKQDQIAFYATDADDAEAFKRRLGLHDKEWVLDTVTANSTVYYADGSIIAEQNVAELQFNYDLGTEVEILRYIKGANWHNEHAERHQPLYISHVGFHLDDDEPFPDLPNLVQETFTISHTATYLTDPASKGYGRKYHYRIHEISPASYLKFIKRVHKDG